LDDVSKDNSRQILADYAEKRPSTSTSFNTKNSGTPFSQWAKGMKSARAEIIWIAEDDDFCEENFLEKLVPLFFNKRIKMAYANSHLVDENNNPIGKYEDIFSKISTKKWNQNYITHAYEEVYESLAIRNTIPNASAVLFRKFDIENILEELKTFKFAGDWYFYLNVLSSGDIGFISDKLNYHRRHSTSTMSILKDDVKLYFGEIEKIHRFVRNNFLLTDVAIDKTIEYIQDEWIYKQRNDRLDEYYGIENLKNSKKSIKRIQNIAVFFSGYYFGGAEVFPINLANAFAEIGHNTYLFNVGALETDARVEAMVSPLVKKVDIIGSTNSVADLRKFLVENNIEFINSQGWFGTDFLQKNLEDSTIPWFASMHGHEENIIEGAWGKEYLQYFEHAMKNTIAKAPKFIYTHEKNLEVFEHFPISEQCNLIGIPTLGMDATLPESNLKSELNIDKDSFVLGFVARGIEEKGWIEVIEAAKILRENYKLKVDLVLIGDSEFVQTLKEKNKNFGYIHFLGYSDEVLSWGQIFDVSLLPSFYKSESHPLVIMGYLLCSNPVITTPLGNIPEMIEYNGETAGYLLQFTQQYRTDPKEIAEIINRYIKDPSLYQQHRAVARKAFEKFDMKVAASKYVEVFNLHS
jgi:glycosyltransferase involved in cell wall biosynthesis